MSPGYSAVAPGEGSPSWTFPVVLGSGGGSPAVVFVYRCLVPHSWSLVAAGGGLGSGILIVSYLTS